MELRQKQRLNYLKMSQGGMESGDSVNDDPVDMMGNLDRTINNMEKDIRDLELREHVAMLKIDLKKKKSRVAALEATLQESAAASHAAATPVKQQAVAGSNGISKGPSAEGISSLLNSTFPIQHPLHTASPYRPDLDPQVYLDSVVKIKYKSIPDFVTQATVDDEEVDVDSGVILKFT